MNLWPLAGTAALLMLSGCTSVPPGRVAEDRLGYGQVIADSWKRQTLLNVVRLRYADAPVLLDVSSVINSYSVAGKASGSAQLPEGAVPNVLQLGGESSWSNTPTVTYQPVMGDRFTRAMLQPVPPVSVFQLIQSGWPVDLVLRTVVGTINGMRNDSFGVAAEPGFNELVEAMTRIQRAGSLGIRVDPRSNGGGMVLVMRRPVSDAALAEDLRRVGELLGLAPGTGEFEIAYGLVPRSPGEVALLTRSMLELLMQVGFGIDLPPPMWPKGAPRPASAEPATRRHRMATCESALAPRCRPAAMRPFRTRATGIGSTTTTSRASAVSPSC